MCGSGDPAPGWEPGAIALTMPKRSSFCATLECELLAGHRFRTHDEARAAVFDWIELLYNRQRRHSALGYAAPDVYERTVTIPTPGAA